MNTSNIDKTHIIALQEEGGMLRNVELPISRPEQFIDEFKAMTDNPNRTVWDLQSHFAIRYPKTKMYQDYLQPFSYNAAYVGGVNYPEFMEYHKLQRSWQEAGESARQAFRKSNNGSISENEAVEKAIENLKKRQKNNFLEEAMRWIDACCYSDAANQLGQDSAVKMYSKENVGWNRFDHEVNDNIKVAVSTNFGYGSAAYFILAMKYKGIDILPYSYLVKYYNVGMADIIRCTRSYQPCRESWRASFDFISDFVNKSIADPEGFVESYLMNEVREMIQGLESIASNPTAFIERIGNRKADPYVINVQPMFNADRSRIQAYPEETPILFKVEKITGALDFLENLTEIAQEVQSIKPYIERLLELNMALYPEVQKAIFRIESKVAKQTLIKDDLDSKMAAVIEKIRPFDQEIQKGYAEATIEKPFDIRSYEAAHHEYVSLKQERNDLSSQLYKVNSLISDFNSFIGILNKSILRLDDIKQTRQAA